MKKILLLSVIFMSSAICSNAAPIGLPPSVGALQSPQSEMKLLRQDQFRKEEYNEFKDMKKQKEERNKQINLEKKQQEQPVSIPTEVNLIEENGQIKLVPVK